MKQINLTDAVVLIKHALKEKLDKNNNLLVAIDGPCAAGKTSIAMALKNEFHCCDIIPIDDFFLQFHQRHPKRLQEPGGNFDRERFINEVMMPLKSGEDFSYRPFDCKKGELSAPVKIAQQPITIIEGVYSCHPELWDYYDYRIFVKTDKNTQIKRLSLRSPRLYNRFLTEWMPMEEKYFQTFDIESKCDLIIEL